MATQKTLKPTAAKNARKSGKTPSCGISIIPEGKYPLIAHREITLPPRPEAGKETDSLFWNPRPLEEVMNEEKMFKLVYSIRLEDLLEPLAVNVVTDPANSVVALKAELLAGERRHHALAKIAKDKLPCVDEINPKPDVFEVGSIVNWKNRFGEVRKHNGDIVTVYFDDHLNDLSDEGKGEVECNYADITATIPGDEKHSHVPCKCYYDLNEERKMRISYSENDNSEPLSVKAEIDLVERLLARNMKQATVAHLLSSNITFVSQRASFRTQLPPEAFAKLMSGQMKAHVAVNMLGYPAEDRQKYFETMCAIEAQDTEQRLRKLRGDKEELEDRVELHEAAANQAEAVGDNATAAKERKRAKTLETLALKAKDRQQRAQSEKGTIKQGHAHRAAARANLMPRKAKMLPKDQIEQVYYAKMAKYAGGGEIDPICDEEIPGELAAIVRRTAKAILEGNHDPLSIIRDYMVENGKWNLPAETAAQKASKKTSNKGPKSKIREDDDEDMEEDDEYEEDNELDDEIGEPSEEDLRNESLTFDEESFDDEERPRRRKRRRRDDDNVGERLAIGCQMLGED